MYQSKVLQIDSESADKPCGYVLYKTTFFLIICEKSRFLESEVSVGSCNYKNTFSPLHM